jgi:hypothetical protein
MSNNKKSTIAKIYPIGAMASATDVDVAFPINGLYNFSISVLNSSSLTIAYTIYTAPINEAVAYTQITATSVATSGNTINTFDGNNCDFCKLTFTGATASGGYSAGFIRIVLSYNER